MQKPIVVFILGGPGSGKGTQSELLRDRHNFVHLSAGDLLRTERKNKDSQDGALIEKYIVQGKIVPSQITVKLLGNAMIKEKERNRFLIDGFPRNQENLQNWLQIMGSKVDTPFIVFLNCPEETMLQRLTKRGETSGRSDDNIESIKKRFKTYNEETMPVIKYFEKDERVIEVNAEGSIEEIYAKLKEGLDKRGMN